MRTRAAGAIYALASARYTRETVERLLDVAAAAQRLINESDVKEIAKSGAKAAILQEIEADQKVATRMADLGVSPHVIEEVLNHRSGHKRGVAGIYNRSRYEREVKAAVATHRVDRGARAAEGGPHPVRRWRQPVEVH